MLLLALSVTALVADPMPVVWRCANIETKQEFSLIYEEKGRKISNVEVAVPGIPRTYWDNGTRWRAKRVAYGIEFHLRVKTTAGEMSLTLDKDQKTARLKWSSIIGIGSHVPLGEPEEEATCTLYGA